MRRAVAGTLLLACFLPTASLSTGCDDDVLRFFSSLVQESGTTVATGVGDIIEHLVDEAVGSITGEQETTEEPSTAEQPDSGQSGDRLC